MCEQVEYGFDCVCDFVEAHPGDKNFSCEYCGIYTASEARCNKCEEFEEIE